MFPPASIHPSRSTIMLGAVLRPTLEHIIVACSMRWRLATLQTRLSISETLHLNSKKLSFTLTLHRNVTSAPSTQLILLGRNTKYNTTG